MATATKPAADGYTAEAIEALEGLEPVRKRPDMYIGSTDEKGLHHLVWEIVDNAVDEYINGYADRVTVTLHASGRAVTITDNGRGIPEDIHPKHKKSGLELVLTVLHAGGKFGTESSGYIHSGGLHGVGASVVNALSKKLVATVRRNGFEWRQSFARGVPDGPVEKVAPSRGRGTTIYFEPDETVLETTKFDAETIRTRLEDMSYVHSGLKITFVNEATGETFDLSHPGGIPEFLGRLVKEGGKDPVTEAAFTLARTTGDRVEVALQWTESTSEAVRSFANGIRTPSGGTHENGLKSAVVKAVRNFAKVHEVKAFKGIDVTAEDIREGLVGVLSVFVRNPKFQGQTKERLQNTEMTAEVDNFVRPALEGWLNANMSAADAIVGRIVLAAKARLASREAVAEVKRKTLTNRRLTLPGKLADCKSTERDETELFIVEGDSAGGSAKQGRDNATQAVLPLRGKILNSEGLPLSKVLTNQELSDLVTTVGTGAGDKFDLSGLRYGKIILLMDADADGGHISTLLLTFFFRQMRKLIEAGHVYIAQPPLYKVVVGKETMWARDDDHLGQIRSKLRANAKPTIMRFKGLGEMNAKELKETTLDPRHRVLLRVDVESLIDADRTFEIFMGKEVKDRYEAIMESRDFAADELDV